MLLLPCLTVVQTVGFSATGDFYKEYESGQGERGTEQEGEREMTCEKDTGSER